MYKLGINKFDPHGGEYWDNSEDMMPCSLCTLALMFQRNILFSSSGWKVKLHGILFSVHMHTIGSSKMLVTVYQAPWCVNTADHNLKLQRGSSVTYVILFKQSCSQFILTLYLVLTKRDCRYTVTLKNMYFIFMNHCTNVHMTNRL